MSDYRFERECRTPYSEVYNVFEGDDVLGRIDLHFTTASVYGSLVVVESVTEDDVHELISVIDEELVMSADPYRTNFVVQVYQGRELGIFSDLDSDDDDDDDGGDGDDDSGSNGPGRPWRGGRP